MSIRLIAMSMLVALALSAHTAPAPGAEEARMPTVLITGSNRGIGLELVRQYADKGWRVIATVRDPASAEELRAIAARAPSVAIEKLDVASSADLDALAAKYAGQPIDVLINNAGILGEREKQTLAQLDYATFEEVMRVNAFAPLAISRAFLENVAASEQKKIVAITSGLSSLTNTQRFGNFYFYRSSKAALNMMMRALQADVRARGIRVGILAPGEVETRLLRQSGYSREGIPPEKSVAALIRNIEALADQDPEIVLYDGSIVPW